LEVVGGEITGKDGETYSIPSLSEQHYEGGVANSDAMEDGTKIAGLEFKDKSGPHDDTSNWAIKQYLLKEDWSTANTKLTALLGVASDYTEDEGAFGFDYTTVTNSAKGTGKIVLETVTYDADAHRDYRVARWVEVGTGSMAYGYWEFNGWSDVAAADFPDDNTSTKIISVSGGPTETLTYTDSVSDTGTITYKFYAVSFGCKL